VIREVGEERSGEWVGGKRREERRGKGSGVIREAGEERREDRREER
jgi:hypothetical protein